MDSGGSNFMSVLNFDDATPEPMSLVDDVGRLTWWNDRPLRLISEDHADHYRSLVASPVIRKWFGKGLVSTEVSDMSASGYGVVLEHEKLPIVTYPAEWSSEMFRDAVALVLDLGTDLLQHGFTLKDAHPWNIVFDDSGPQFVDWGSIIRADGVLTWPYFEFRGTMLLPYYLMAAGLDRMVRRLMADDRNRLLLRDVLPLLLNRVPTMPLLNYVNLDRRIRKSSTGASIQMLIQLRHRFKSIAARPQPTEWSDYPEQALSLDSKEGWQDKHLSVDRVLAELRPESVLDIGCNKGWFSELASHTGARVISMDVDDTSVNVLYRKSKMQRLPITPLVMDFCRPTPAHGLGSGFQSAIERFRSQFVLCLAVTHHLVFKQHLSFEFIARQLATFTEQWLVVEFVPPEDVHVERWMSSQYSWYCLEGFMDALRRYFHTIHTLPSAPYPRVLLVCEK
jgi:SAM-dependent methyltransferase